MGYSILIAENRDVLRAGLRTIFANDPLVTRIDDVSTSEELKQYLTSMMPDLIVVQQALMINIVDLPRGRFVILATEPDKNILLTAFAFGARGYLLENASADLFFVALRITGRKFLLDPALAPWLLESISGDILPSSCSEMLTTREQEIFDLLLHSDLTNRAIGEKLCISEATVKTHIAHIFRKLHIRRRPMKVLSTTVSEGSRRNGYESLI